MKNKNIGPRCSCWLMSILFVLSSISYAEVISESPKEEVSLLSKQQVIANYFTGMQELDADKMASGMAEHIKFRDPLRPFCMPKELPYGKAAFIDWFATHAKNANNVSVNIDQEFTSGSYAVFQGTINTVFPGSLFPQTQQKVVSITSPFVTLFVFNNGKISEIIDYFDYSGFVADGKLHAKPMDYVSINDYFKGFVARDEILMTSGMASDAFIEDITSVEIFGGSKNSIEQFIENYRLAKPALLDIELTKKQQLMANNIAVVTGKMTIQTSTTVIGRSDGKSIPLQYDFLKILSLSSENIIDLKVYMNWEDILQQMEYHKTQ